MQIIVMALYEFGTSKFYIISVPIAECKQFENLKQLHSAFKKNIYIFSYNLQILG